METKKDYVMPLLKTLLEEKDFMQRQRKELKKLLNSIEVRLVQIDNEERYFGNGG